MVSAQGYVFLLLRSNPSLLGLGYLGLCIAIFLNPPLRGEFEERDEMGRVVEGPESTVTKIYRGCWSAAGNVIMRGLLNMVICVLVTVPVCVCLQ